ncbi:MAG: D-tyrosyl-tRNA(Tyr) deacylase [Dehalococcoidia bacterium]|nr:D-tyrosyl-tRNA(Tyr) deacylase [Dehalococcoidia bacterium]MSQ17177.1 D-tyrosyl-tRNA(Tyr) deacylase [Dehalococcoidia bacterium]
MRALVQRVTQALVLVDQQEVGRIGRGLLVFLGVAQGDTDADGQYLADKIANLRIFADSDNRFNRSALDLGAEILLVSQFTLHADTRRGRRPDFTQAAPPEEAQPLYLTVAEQLRGAGLSVATGRFGAHMQVSLTNDGPVTILLDSTDRQRPRSG